jgi:hypothetical protein
MRLGYALQRDAKRLNLSNAGHASAEFTLEPFASFESKLREGLRAGIRPSG